MLYTNKEDKDIQKSDVQVYKHKIREGYYTTSGHKKDKKTSNGVHPASLMMANEHLKQIYHVFHGLIPSKERRFCFIVAFTGANPQGGSDKDNLSGLVPGS